MPAEHCFVYRASSLGDVVLTTGVLGHWHRTRGLRFSVATREPFAPLLEGHPAMREVVALGDDDLRGLRWADTAARLARGHSGETLVDLHGTIRSRVLGLFWKGPVRRHPKASLQRRMLLRGRAAGSGLLELTVPQRYALALDETPPPARELLPEIHLSDAERREAAELLAERGIETPFIALHPYSTHSAKTWPPDIWRRLATMLDEAGLPWVCIGCAPESIFSGPRDLTNATDIRTTAAVLSHARCLVTGDSGPMHVACGVGTPVVALFGPTTKEWGFQPAGERDVVLERDLPCRPCSVHGGSGCERGVECLASITPDEVLAAVQAVRA